MTEIQTATQTRTTTVPHLLHAAATRTPDRIAFRDDVRAVTYGDLWRRTDNLAGHLAALGLDRGARAMVCLPTGVPAVESYLGVVRAGGVGVPVGPQCTDDELAHLLTDAEPRVVVTDAGNAERFRRLAPRVATVLTGPEFESRCATTPPPPAAREPLGPDEPAWVFYTSGTTAQPKGVVSSQRGYTSSAADLSPGPLGVTAADRLLCLPPLSHGFGFWMGVVCPLLSGASVRLLAGFAPVDVLATLRREDITYLVGVPTMYHELVRAARGQDRPAALRVCMTSGAPCPPALRGEVDEVFHAPLLDVYGASEACGAITTHPDAGVPVPGSCGVPADRLRLRVVDPRTGVDVPAGAEGEVWVAGQALMLGYHNRPDATAAAMTGPWYRTGDLGRQAPSGHLTLTGRVKEIIIRGGENVHPAEVEHVVRGVPGIADAAVVGRPHEVLGEVAVVAVVPGDRGFDPLEVIARCRAHLSPFKVPHRVVEVDAIPRSPSGKIRRGVLRDRLAGAVLRYTAPEDGQADARTEDPGELAHTLALLPPDQQEDVLVARITAFVDPDGAHGAVDPDLTFTQLGVESMRAVRLRDRLVAATGVDLPVTATYDHPTPRALARRLLVLLAAARVATTQQGGR